MCFLMSVLEQKEEPCVQSLCLDSRIDLKAVGVPSPCGVPCLRLHTKPVRLFVRLFVCSFVRSSVEASPRSHI